jgi:ArsR family transcriptional regulator, arsenate/arsenite/antimonite-responsive transcriptional repressor
MMKLVETAEAIFDDYRLQVIKLLQIREMCVCELAAVLNLSSPRISQHLAILRRSKIVKERREGKWIFYSLIPKTMDDFNKSWNQFLEAAPDQTPEMKNVIKRLQKMDLAGIREKCVTPSATKKASRITKQTEEGIDNGN